MDSEKVHRQVERTAKRMQDAHDLNNEMAGRDVGRINRFFGEASSPRADGDKRKAEREAQLTNLQMLMMNDPAYAQLFRETETKLRQAQNRLDAALEAIRLEKERIEEALFRENLTDQQRQEELERLDALAELEADVLAGQAEIGDMQERMDDQRDPTSASSMQDFTERAESIVSDIERRVQNEMSRSAPAPQSEHQEVKSASTLDVPTL